MLKVQHVILKIPEQETKHSEIACLLCGSTFPIFYICLERKQPARYPGISLYIIYFYSHKIENPYNFHDKNGELNENVNSHKIDEGLFNFNGNRSTVNMRVVYEFLYIHSKSMEISYIIP